MPGIRVRAVLAVSFLFFLYTRAMGEAQVALKGQQSKEGWASSCLVLSWPALASTVQGEGISGCLGKEQCAVLITAPIPLLPQCWGESEAWGSALRNCWAVAGETHTLAIIKGGFKIGEHSLIQPIPFCCLCPSAHLPTSGCVFPWPTQLCVPSFQSYILKFFSRPPSCVADWTRALYLLGKCCATELPPQLCWLFWPHERVCQLSQSSSLIKWVQHFCDSFHSLSISQTF